MSSPADATFLAAWRNRDQREAATLIKVELTRPSTKTIYLSGREDVVTPGATPQPWQGGILADIEPLDFPGSLRTSSWEPGSGGFTLVNGQFEFQAGTALTVRDAFKTYGWIGAAVTFYLWEKSMTDFTKALAFKGFRVQDYELEKWTVAVRVLQRWDWNRQVALKRVTRKKYPRAAEEAVNRYIPKVRGSVRGAPMRSPFLSAYGDDQQGRDLVAGAVRGVPGLVVDAGGGGVTPGTPTKIAFASHACKTFHDQTLGCMPLLAVDDKLCQLDPAVTSANNVFSVITLFTITRGGVGSFITDGVQVGDKVAGAIASSFPADTRVTIVAALTLTVDKAATATTGPVAGRFFHSFNNSTDGAGFTVADVSSGGNDPFGIAFYPLPAVNVELVAANNAQNPRSALDIANESSFAYLDYDAGYRELKVRFPTVSQAGEAITFYCGTLYKSSGSMANVRFQIRNDTSLLNEITPTGYANPTFQSLSTPTTYGGVPTEAWGFGELFGRIYFSAAAAGVKLWIYGMGGIVLFRPKREIIGETTHQVLRPDERRRPRPRGEPPRPIPQFDSVTDRVFSAKGLKWFTTLDGQEDDGGGTYTGVANALVERAPDIVQLLLVEDGAETTADITTAGSTFGSFVDARASLKTWRQSDMVHALVHDEPERVAEALQRLADDAGIWIYLSEFDDKWKCIVWKKGTAANYDLTIGKESLGHDGMGLRPTPGTRREVGIDVPYSYDYFRGQPIYESSIGPSSSAAGRKYYGLRDAMLSVYASGDDQNNKLDFKIGGVDYTATLATADYAPMDLAVEVATKTNTAHAANWTAGYGPFIRSAWNQKIYTQRGAPTTTTTIPAAEYATMEDLAAAVQAALQASDAGGGWTCTYSRTTRKFTIAGGGTLLWATGSPTNTTAMVTLGYKFADLGVSPYVADYEREEQLFHVGNLSAAFDIKWQTGTNGSDGTNTSAAILLGFDTTQDSLNSGATDTSFQGISPKHDKEQTVADTTTTVTGEVSSRRMRGDTIYDDDTAREVRDRAFDLFGVDRPEIGLQLLDCPDLERGRVVACAASLDAIMPYAVEGSDGSWVGKKLQCVAKRQHLAGSYITEATLVDVS